MLPDDARRVGWIFLVGGLSSVLAFVLTALWFNYAGSPAGDNLVGTLLMYGVLAVIGVLVGMRFLKRAVPSGP